MEWTTNPLDIPKVVWISGLGNPTSFLTAIKQVTAQKEKLELDKLVIQTEVTKKMSVEDVEERARDGAFANGFYMEGARWDVSAQIIDKSQPKEMFVAMPVICCRAITGSRADSSTFRMPVYRTRLRRNFVFSASLKTKSPPARWILAGSALLLDVGYD